MTNENTNKVPFKDGMIGPTVILLIICLVISGALAFTYQLTKGQIEKINKETADAARLEVLPGAGSFTACDADPLPEGVTEYYYEDTGLGAVATVGNKSFGGTITVMVGMDADGVITGVKVTDHSDTPGLGTKAHDSEYLKDTYVGLDALDDVDSIKKDSNVSEVTGATVSSNGIYGCVKYALAAYDELGGVK